MTEDKVLAFPTPILKSEINNDEVEMTHQFSITFFKRADFVLLYFEKVIERHWKIGNHQKENYLSYKIKLAPLAAFPTNINATWFDQ